MCVCVCAFPKYFGQAKSVLCDAVVAQVFDSITIYLSVSLSSKQLGTREA